MIFKNRLCDSTVFFSINFVKNQFLYLLNNQFYEKQVSKTNRY
jgi:hypothetical protein